MDDLDKELKALFDSPLLDMSPGELALFDVPEHLGKKKEKAEADFVAQRTKCEDFDLYEEGFLKVHKELKEGARSLIKFQESHYKEGTYFIVGGVLMLLDKIYESKKDQHHKLDGRTHCVFENGTESNMLLRSLGKALFIDGYTVQESVASTEEAFQNHFGVKDADIQDGWIYVLRSLSEDPGIKGVADLYKIGFSTTPVEERIKNAENDPTYLMGKVKIVASWKTYNMKTHQFENIIHKFFSAVQFHVKVQDINGLMFTPREWFVVPLKIIEATVEKIIDGSIVNYQYNRSMQMLEERTKHSAKEKPASQIDTTGWAILTLNIKQIYFDQILSGDKKAEFRELKQSKLNMYTWLDEAENKRYLKRFDALKLYVGYKRDRASALVEVINTEYDSDSRMVVYHLGKVLEVIS